VKTRTNLLLMICKLFDELAPQVYWDPEEGIEGEECILLRFLEKKK